MQIHFNFIIKFFLFITPIFFSFLFFYTGYYELKKIDTKINSKPNIYSSKNFFEEKIIYNNKNINPHVIQEFEKNILVEKHIEKIIITVKKYDTFTELIDPFVSNKKNKQKIITLINNEYNLKSLKINQKIFLYLNNKKNI